MKRAAFAIALVSLLTVSAVAARRRKNPVISRITIRGTDIFDMELNPRLRHFPYTWINTLHIQTKEEVIRRELLFKVGDRLDPFLVSETERNLRALPFIRAARIAKFPQRDGTVALVVHVNDAWTTEPQLNLGGVNKVEETEFGFREKNILGYGKEGEFLYSKGKDFIRRTYEFTDPRLLGSRFQLQGNYMNETAGATRSIKLDRPFYSADSRWSVSGSHERSALEIKQFENNVEVSRFEQTKELSEVAASAKVGRGRAIVNHLGVRYQREGRWYAPSPNTNPAFALPENQKIQTVFADFDSGRNDFIEITHLEKMTRVEDINLGPTFQMSPGYSPHAISGQPNASQFQSSFEKRYFIHDTDLFHERLSYNGRNTFDNAENEVFEVMLKYYRRPSDFHTTVFHTRLDWGNQLDPDNLIKLGGDNGLRAYESDRFVGSRSWVMNVEERLFLIDEAFNLFAVGAAFFADSGYAWPQGHPISMTRMRSEVGTGLRLGLTRSSNEVVLRFDISYRMQTDDQSKARWVFTFGSGQAF